MGSRFDAPRQRAPYKGKYFDPVSDSIEQHENIAPPPTSRDPYAHRRGSRSDSSERVLKTGVNGFYSDTRSYNSDSMKSQRIVCAYDDEEDVVPLGPEAWVEIASGIQHRIEPEWDRDQIVLIGDDDAYGGYESAGHDDRGHVAPLAMMQDDITVLSEDWHPSSPSDTSQSTTPGPQISYRPPPPPRPPAERYPTPGPRVFSMPLSYYAQPNKAPTVEWVNDLEGQVQSLHAQLEQARDEAKTALSNHTSAMQYLVDDLNRAHAENTRLHSELTAIRVGPNGPPAWSDSRDIKDDPLAPNWRSNKDNRSDRSGSTSRKTDRFNSPALRSARVSRDNYHRPTEFGDYGATLTGQDLASLGIRDPGLRDSDASQQRTTSTVPLTDDVRPLTPATTDYDARDFPFEEPAPAPVVRRRDARNSDFGAPMIDTAVDQLSQSVRETLTLELEHIARRANRDMSLAIQRHTTYVGADV